MSVTMIAKGTTQPASIQEAQAEIAELTSEIMQIDADLGTAKDTGEFDPHWRRRAIDAKRHMNDRKRFLRSWVLEQRSSQHDTPTLPTNRALIRQSLSGISATMLMREATKRIAALESVYVASVNALNDPTYEHDAEWRDCVQRAMQVLEAGETEGDDA